MMIDCHSARVTGNYCFSKQPPPHPPLAPPPSPPCFAPPSLFAIQEFQVSVIMMSYIRDGNGDTLINAIDLTDGKYIRFY